MASRPRDELVVVVAAAATFGTVLASYSAFRPVRDALILDGDPDRIPWLFTATFVVVLALAPVWGRLVARGPRHVVPIAFHAFALCALGFAAANRAELAPVMLGRVFYVWSAVFNLFVVSVFWSLLADLLGPTAARRLYGPIAAGGTVGAIVGPLLTKALVGTVGVAGILVVSAVLLEVAALGVIAVRRAARKLESGGHDDNQVVDQPVAGGAFDGLTHVARSRYLRSIVGYVLCTSCAATFIYLAQAHIAKDLLPDRLARTELFASIDVWVNVATLVVQLVVAGPIIGWLGPGLVLCVLPLVQGVGIAVLATVPSIAALMGVAIAGRTATHGLTRPARELLFTVLDREDKYRAKNVIDTVAYRFGDVASGWLGQALGAAGAMMMTVATLPLVGVWIVLAGSLGAGFRRRAAATAATKDDAS